MYIKELEGTGVKGRDFSHALERAVLFVGQNFKGKTARLEAIRFALRGYIPELGKQASATSDLGDPMEVSLKFDTGEAVTRGISNGKLVAVLEDEPLFLNEPMPFLDPSEYFGLTESERIQYIFRMMQMPDSYSVESITADLRNITLDENTEETEKARTAVILTVEKALREGISVGLTELTRDKGELKTQFAYYNKRAKETVGTVRVLSELKTREGEFSADTIHTVATELAKVRANLEAANQELGAITNRKMEANRVELRRGEIETELKKPKDDASGKIAALQKDIAAAQKKIDISITEEKVKAARQKWTAAEALVTEACESRDALQSQIDELDGKVKDVAKLKSCPTCHAAGKNWKAGITKEYKAQIAALEKELAKQQARASSLVTKADFAKSAMELTEKKWRTVDAAEQAQLSAQQAIDRIKANEQAVEARQKALREELARLAKSTPPSEKDLNAAAEKAAKLKTSDRELSDKHTKLVGLQQDLLRAEEAATEHVKAQAYVTIIKRIGEVLKLKQAEMIDVLFRDLLKTANYFTDGIMEHPLAFHEGEIGYFKGGRFVKHKVFSGTEEALTYVAFAAALSRKSKFKLVLLDELGRLDHARKRLVTDRLAKAVRDKIVDQVIAIDTVTTESDDWQVIEL